MKILYLTYDGLLDPLGQSQIQPYLEGLVGKGHEITVVSFEKPSAFAEASADKEAGSRKPEAGNPNSNLRFLNLKIKNDLNWCPLRYHKRPPILSTLYDLWQLRRTVNKIIKEYKPDIIHCRSYITSIVGLRAKRKHGIKFIFDMRGLWADERVEAGLWNPKNPIFRLIYYYFKNNEREFIQEADAVISLTENARNVLLDRYSVDLMKPEALPTGMPYGRSSKSAGQSGRICLSDKIWIIPSCVDMNLFDPGMINPEEQEELRKSLGMQKKDFVLLYLGSLGTWYMLEEMMQFYVELKKVRKNSKFFILTKEDQVVSSWLIAHSKEMEMGYWKEFRESIIMRNVDRKEMPRYISLCNVSIFFIKPTFSKAASSATKMGEAMAMGKPVITNTGWGDVEQIIDQGRDGLLINVFSPEAYIKSIALLNSIMKTPPDVIREKAVRFLSLEMGVNEYDQIYKRLVTTPRY